MTAVYAFAVVVGHSNVTVYVPLCASQHLDSKVVVWLAVLAGFLWAGPRLCACGVFGTCVMQVVLVWPGPHLFENAMLDAVGVRHELDFVGCVVTVRVMLPAVFVTALVRATVNYAEQGFGDVGIIKWLSLVKLVHFGINLECNWPP